MRLHVPAAVAAVAIAAAAAGVAGVAGAGTPDGAALERLRSEARRSPAIAWCAAGRFELRRARFDSSGVWSDDPAAYRAPRTAVVQMKSDPGVAPPPKPIAWDDVDSIAVGVRHVGPARAALATATFVAVVAAPIVAAGLLSSSQSEGFRTLTMIAVSGPAAAAGIATVWLLTPRHRLVVVYRAR